jgi:hypothetical protein
VSIRLKSQLVRFGRHLDERTLAHLRSALGYLELGALAQEQLGSALLAMTRDRFTVFREALPRISGDAPLYLEFGVFQGETLRWWSRHLRQPAAHLVGFDSFVGLPETWRPGFDAGEFATPGSVPEIADERVELVKGWFEDTLPSFELPPHDQLVVNVDSDLYTSARTVLTWVAPFLQSGSLIYFDELADRDHELRALKELLSATDVELRPLAAGAGGAHFLFEVC